MPVRALYAQSMNTIHG